MYKHFLKPLCDKLLALVLLVVLSPIILGTMLLLHWISRYNARLGRIILIAYLLMCLIFFVAFYPYASAVGLCCTLLA